MPYPTYPAVSVPEVPTRSLEHYLDFWESERAAARSLQNPAWASTPYHAERDINVPVPQPWFFAPGGRNFLSFAGVECTSPELRAWSAGSGLAVVGQPMGQDPTAVVNRQSGIMYVSGRWAQQAANAFLAALGVPASVDVDGVVGTQTIGTLRALMLRWVATLTHTEPASDTGQTMAMGLPMPARSGPSVALATTFGDYLSGLTQVADPPPRARQPAPSSPTPAPVMMPDSSSSPPPLPYADRGGGSGGLVLLAVLGIGAAALFARSR